MTPEYLAAFGLVIGSEGGYVNDPHDPGGETKFGISKRAYPHLEIATLTVQDAQSIYWTDYWCRLALDTLPWQVAYPAFDTAVNLGVFRTSGMLKTALRSSNPARTLLSARLRYYRTLATYERFGAGWEDRVVGVALVAGGKPDLVS